MKKILVALALAAIASTTYATVAGSAHDFSVTGPNATYRGTAGSCQYCHAPHLWNPSNLSPTLAPLWNRNGPAVGATTNSRGSVTDVTRACLSCHDGVTGIGQMVNNPDATLAAVVIAGPVGLVGLDLDNDHPVGVPYLPGGEYNPLPAAFVLEGPVATPTVGCSTCHDVHNAAGNPSFLVVDPGAVDFCAQCHNK